MTSPLFSLAMLQPLSIGASTYDVMILEKLAVARWAVGLMHTPYKRIQNRDWLA